MLWREVHPADALDLASQLQGVHAVAAQEAPEPLASAAHARRRAALAWLGTTRWWLLRMQCRVHTWAVVQQEGSW